MSDRAQNTGNSAMSKDEREDLLLRIALTERKLVLTAQKLQIRTQELASIHRLSETIGSERQIDRLCEKTADEICRTLGSATVCILLLDEHSGELVSAAVTGSAAVPGYRPRLKPGNGPLWQAIKTGKPFQVPAGRTGRTEGWSQPGIAVPITAKGKVLGLIHAASKLNGKEYSARERDLLCGIASQAAVALDNATLYHELENLFVGIAWSFASALDAKSPWTAGHSKRVTQYAVAIAEELGHAPEFLTEIQTCGLLHDIGKIAIPEKILDKPGRVTREELRTITEHATQGAKILEHIDTFQPLLPGIRHHHERWDGRGFPNQLCDEEIPLMARILSVADAYDAITSDRPYRKRRTRADALLEIERCAGTQFDPEVVEAFLSVTSHRIF
jgi:putative nucleotidyltransferase with HDIG domain